MSATRALAASTAALLAAALACAEATPTGPLKGVLLAVDAELSDEAALALADSSQLYVTTVDAEPVFDFSYCDLDDLDGDLRTRRTIVVAVSSEEDLPVELEPLSAGISHARDLWADGQDVYGLVLPGFDSYGLLAGLLEESYDRHLKDYVYGSFVATQMSSPERIDSLMTLGFSMDIPKSYHLRDWDPEDGFVQYQRRVSEHCLLLMSVRWVDDARTLTGEEAVTWRESVARRFFYDAEADSVDRSRVEVSPLTHAGMEGYRLLGMWRNPEHINAGAFTSYVLFGGERRWLLDMEVFHEGREKEPYIREGWIIMDTFQLAEE